MRRLAQFHLLGLCLVYRRGAAQDETTLTVTNPNSADVYKVGDSVSVEWTYTADSLYFDLTLLDNGEQVWPLCNAGGCQAPNGAQAVTLPEWLGAGRKYSILVVDRDADSSSTITNNSLYGESELFQVVSEGSGTAGFGTSIQFLLGALLGSAAAVIVLLVTWLVVRQVRKRRRASHRAALRPKSICDRMEQNGIVDKDKFESSSGESSEGVTGRIPSITSMPGLDEMGTLSPVQEENAAVVTTNPMRAAIAHGSQFESIGGQSSRRDDGEDDDEESDGMFADAAIVAALAAAAAQRAQKGDQPSSTKKSSSASSRWGWQGTAWVRSTSAEGEELAGDLGREGGFEMVAKTSALAGDAARHSSSSIHSIAARSDEHQVEGGSRKESRLGESPRSSSSPCGEDKVLKVGAVSWRPSDALKALEESTTRPVSPSEDSSRSPHPTSTVPSVADCLANSSRHVFGSGSEPECEVPRPGAAVLAVLDGGSRKVDSSNVPMITVQGVKEDVKVVGEQGKSSETPPHVCRVPRGPESTSQDRMAAEPETAATSLRPDRIPRLVARKGKKPLAVAVSTIAAVAEQTALRGLSSEDESDRKTDEDDLHDDALQLPPKRSGTQPGSPRRCVPTALTPSLRSNISSNASSATPDRLFTASNRKRSARQSASWIASMSSSSPDCAPRKSVRTPGIALGGMRSSGQWPTIVATPDRVSGDFTLGQQKTSSHIVPTDLRRRSWNTPVATPNRVPTMDPPRTNNPDVGSLAATVPARTGSSELGSVAGRQGVSPTDESQFVWQLDSPAGVDGMPSPKDSDFQTLPLTQTRGRAFANIFRAAQPPEIPSIGASVLMTPEPPDDSASRYRKNSSGDTSSSFDGWESEGRAEEERFLATRQVTGYKPEVKADSDLRSGAALAAGPEENSPSFGPTDELFYSADADDEIMQLASKRAMEQHRKRGGRDPFDEAAEVAALVAEAMALADKESDHAIASRRLTGEDVHEGDTESEVDSEDVASAPRAKRPNVEMSDAEESWGSGRSALSWREGGPVEEEEDGDAERDAEEVQALIAEALALVNEGSDDAKVVRARDEAMDPE